MSKNVLITGAGSAIAQAVARRWATRGYAFYLVDLDEKKAWAVANDLQVRGAKKALGRGGNLVNLSRHNDLIDEAKKRIGPIDILLIAHGLLGNQERAQTDPEHAKIIMDVNFISAALLAGRVANEMEKRKNGVIAIIGSVAGDRGRQSIYVYGAAKGALAIYAAGLRSRLADTGIHVLTIKPGYVITSMTTEISEKGKLWVVPSKVAKDIVRAVDKKTDVLYTPWFWRYIMLIIKHIPERVFKRMSL